MRSLLPLAGLALLAGCPPPAENIIILDERFEEPVGARWTVTGVVQQVETYHPAEHGAQFVSATTMSIPIDLTVYDEFSDGNWIEYSSSCGGTPEVWRQYVAPQQYELHVAIPDEVDDTTEFERVHANLPPLPGTLGGDPASTYNRLVLEVYRGGPCIIDNLLVVQPEPESGW